ncbi:hypothetical protein JCM5353_003702 [Sporobolomyces roseus]
MVLQNKHKAAASRQYKKSHNLPPSASTSTSTSSTSTSTPKETGQERSLRLGSNADRYIESDEEEGRGEDEEVDQELIAHQASEAEALASFLAAQQEKLANPTSVSAKQRSDDDDEDVDDSFRHLRIAGGVNKKGKVIRGERESGLEGEAKRAQAIRDLKDRFAVSSPPPPSTTTIGSNGTRKGGTPIATMRKPPPLPNQNPLKEGSRGGEDFLDSLL